MVNPERIEIQSPSMFACMVLIDILRERTCRYDEMLPKYSAEVVEQLAGIEYGLLGEILEHLKRLDPEAAEQYSRYRSSMFDEACQGRIVSIEYKTRCEDMPANPHTPQK